VIDVLKGLGNLANLGTILKQAQQMGSTLQNLLDQLKQKRVLGTAGGGLVEVEASGASEILRVTIDPSLVARQDREMIEDLLPAAINQALARARELHSEALDSATQSLQLPGLSEALTKLTGDDRNEP
jgi:DNA-binding YbaB/EbfC family protein